MNIEFLESEQAAYKMLDDFFAKNPECGDFQIDRLSGDILSPEALAVFRRSKEPHWQTYKEESRPKGSWYKAYRRYVEACIPSLQKAWLADHPKGEQCTEFAISEQKAIACVIDELERGDED